MLASRALPLLLVTASLVACSTPAPTPTPEEPPQDSAPVEATQEKPAEAPLEPPPELCPLDGPDGWEGCAGQDVRVTGDSTTIPMQHPVSAAPESPDGTPAQKQDYLQVEGVGQIVIVSADGVPGCKALEVEGKLERVDLGGAPGTKNSYKGWVLHATRHTCKAP